MLHKVNLPDCVKELEEVLQLQRRIIELADLYHHFYINKKHHPYIIKLSLHSYDAGEWFWEKLWKHGNPSKNEPNEFQKQFMNLVDFLQKNPNETDKILDAFDNDINFHNNLDNPDFRFLYNTLSDETKEVIKPFMISFYENLLASGFPTEIHKGDKKIDRDEFIAAYWRENEKLEVCAGCDREKSDAIQTKTFDDADHFLPKSKYPFLSIHPYNLFPLCVPCNRTFKKDKDMVDNHNDSPLPNIFHPYLKPALEKIDVQVYRNKYGVNYLGDFIDKEGMPSRRIANLLRVFKLNKRWEKKLNYHKKEIVDLIIDEGIGLQSILKYRPSIDTREAFKDSLERKLQNRIKNLGQKIGYVLQSSYLSYVLNDKEEFEELYNRFIGAV